MSLEEMLPDGITEVIVTTISSEGIPNAAPMGIVRRGDRMVIRMYPGTRTLKNVKETGYLVANFTLDPLIYVTSAFEDLNCGFFVFEQGMLPPRLKDAFGWVYFKCKTEGVVELEPVDVKVVERRVPRFSRGFAAVIDAAILGTRMHLFKEDEARKKFHEYDVIVNKCGGSKELEAMKKLKEILGFDGHPQ
ncbi:DUF447 domain-containing protein [Methanocella sp. CWC-04]|uniref:DUF447 domain-containing protein n=1 Tax=Methanooceanicella nereidis TaxID=2052831 RepID=A0AAP2RGD2_9EURY|nr:DUF447 domain-containing protein [Methanocella sp. CWC-04]MCD1295645.1 DUF447 domain-containing protein [Methanocella sp. CWC-04]